MRLEVAEAIVKAADNLGVYATLLPHYSGRGMFGRSTAAVKVNDLATLLKAVAYASRAVYEKEDEDGALQYHHFLGGLHVGMESMGMGFVIY